MKELKIGETTYKLCESVNDIYDIRFPVFLNYLRMSVENVDKPLFAATFERAEARFDKGQFHKGLMEFADYRSSITLEQVSWTGLSMCFALICLKENEDQANKESLKEDAMQKKLTKMRKDGLTRGLVEESVSNFIKASPNSFGDYAILQEIISQMSEIT